MKVEFLRVPVLRLEVGSVTSEVVETLINLRCFLGFLEAFATASASSLLCSEAYASFSALELALVARLAEFLNVLAGLLPGGTGTGIRVGVVARVRPDDGDLVLALRVLGGI